MVLSSSLLPLVVGPCGPSRERAAVLRDDWAAAKDGVSKKKTKEKNHKTYDIPECGAYECKDMVVLSSSPHVLAVVVSIGALWTLKGEGHHVT